MLRSLLLVALAVLLATPVDAQRRRDRDRSHPDGFAQKGDIALTFGINGLNLAPFEGGVGARFWVSDKTVLATSLGFNVSTGDYDETRWGTRFALGAERHVGGSRRVSPFLGLGAAVGYSEATYDDVYYLESTIPCDDAGGCPDYYPYPYSSGARQTSIGVAGFLGAEVKLADGITLAAAHRLGVTYTRDSRDQIYYDFPEYCPGCYSPNYNETIERISVGTGTSSLTLSIYL